MGFPLFCIFVRNGISVTVIVTGKIVNFNGIAGFLMGLKPDIVSINHQFCHSHWTTILAL